MFIRLVIQSFRRQQRRKLLALAAITSGVSVATAMMAVATDVGDKINRELRSYGANIVLLPQAETLQVELGGVSLKPPGSDALLAEADLGRIKGIFWRNNIVGFAPFLRTSAVISSGAESFDAPLIGTYFAKRMRWGQEDFTTGVRSTHPWWKVRGEWPDDSRNDQVLLGERLAQRIGADLGQSVELGGQTLTVSGVLSTGGAEDDAVVAPLALAQQLAGKPGGVREVLVSALTKPEDDFARRDPAGMTPEEHDRWYCSPYANSIAYQLNEAIPGGTAQQIRQVAQNEGRVLSRITGLMMLVAIAALLAAGLAVSSAMAAAVLERRREIGLLKAMGARRGTVAGLFLAEATVLALVGGAAGFALGLLLARWMGTSIFGAAVELHAVLFPVVLLLALLVTFAGSLLSIRRAMLLDAAVVLRGAR